MPALLDAKERGLEQRQISRQTFQKERLATESVHPSHKVRPQMNPDTFGTSLQWRFVDNRNSDTDPTPQNRTLKGVKYPATGTRKTPPPSHTTDPNPTQALPRLCWHPRGVHSDSKGSNRLVQGRVMLLALLPNYGGLDVRLPEAGAPPSERNNRNLRRHGLARWILK
ncbi:hypothetical protein BaRGS_00018964 [Batillaria attramentaria]|uniref:Uncharacterized protein n=1 Tax=Batillaria attramentaria TaxID=370345 RepID=A0ABD0KR84_9CAEN